MHIIRLERVKSAPPIVTAKVDLFQSETCFFTLAVELIVEISGIEHEAAVSIVNKAHQICPYSNVTRGNIEVKLTVK